MTAEECAYWLAHPEARAALPERERKAVEIAIGIAARPKGWARKTVDLLGPCPEPLTKEELGEDSPN